MDMDYSVLRYDANTHSTFTKKHLYLPESVHIVVCGCGGTHAF